MKGDPCCPRCGSPVRAPGLVSSAWQCDLHGSVHPLRPATQLNVRALNAVLRDARAPAWLPWPLLPGWVMTGIAEAGDERSGARAIATAFSGPSPLGGPGDLILVAEEVGVGLGAYYAGLAGPDPGPMDEDTAANAKIHAAGHPTALWCVSHATPDRAAFVGEALGRWLWAVLWPPEAAHLLYDDLVLVDLRDSGAEIELVPFGALTPRITPGAAGIGG